MKIEIIKRRKGELNLPLVYLSIVGLGGIGIYLLYVLDRIPFFPCVFKSVTGYPCATCGSTRLVLNLLAMDIWSAFLSNPFLFLLGILFGVWGLYGFYIWFTGNKIRIRWTQKEARRFRWGVLILFLLNWLYLILAGM